MTRRVPASVLLGVVALLSTVPLLLGLPSATAQPEARRAVVVVVDDVSMVDLLGVPDFAGLATVGGGGLLSNAVPLRDAVGLLSQNGAWMPGVDVLDGGSMASSDGGASDEALLGLAGRVRQELEGSSAGEVLLVLVSSSPSKADRGAADQLGGIVIARGAPGDLAAAMGEGGTAEAASTVTSDSTRRRGVVVSSDVPETVGAFLGQVPPGGDPGGEQIRTVAGPPPLELHERYLAQRRMYVPVGVAAGLYVTLAGIACVALLALRRRTPGWALRLGSWVALSVPALAVALLAAGHLPSLSYATVVPFIVVVTVGAVLAVSSLARGDVLRPPAWLGGAVLVFFSVEAALGWAGALTPFLGGSQLDGARFYGLPNAFIGLLIGASLYVAQRLRTSTGVALILAVGLLAGLPYVGANLGGSVSLFATAGIWLWVRERGRLGGWRGPLVLAATVLVGAAVVLLAHRLSPFPTHVTRFEQAAGGVAGVWDTFVERLLVGWRLIERNPFALVPVLGLPVIVLVALRPPGPVRDAFQGFPVWRDVVLVTALGGIVAYVANDSGAAACGEAFSLALGGLMYLALRVAVGPGTGKMVGS